MKQTMNKKKITIIDNVNNSEYLLELDPSSLDSFIQQLLSSQQPINNKLIFCVFLNWKATIGLPSHSLDS